MKSIRSYARRATEYVDEWIYGANDGIITTFAVISGAAGADLGYHAIIILGVANLVADGFSMGASSFLAIRTKVAIDQAQGLPVAQQDQYPLPRSLATFSGFVVAGILPLAPFVTGYGAGEEFFISGVAAGIAFFVVGGLRSLATHRSFLMSGIEMLVVGGIASGLAYTVGYFVESVVG